jgi:hypothetical protein
MAKVVKHLARAGGLELNSRYQPLPPKKEPNDLPEMENLLQLKAIIISSTLKCF